MVLVNCFAIHKIPNFLIIVSVICIINKSFMGYICSPLLLCPLLFLFPVWQVPFSDADATGCGVCGHD